MSRPVEVDAASSKDNAAANEPAARAGLDLPLNAEFFPSSSWQAKAVSLALRRAVKPAVSKVKFTPRIMKFSQLFFDTITLALPINTEAHISPAHHAGIAGEWLSAGRDIVSGRVMLYLHGGGYFFGSPRSHRALTWRLSKVCRAKVIALDYRQPPDWQYPAPLEDAVSAYKMLLSRGYNPKDIVFAGDSAGGNLVLVTLLKLRERDIPMPGAAVLISPWGDLSCSGESVVTNEKKEQLIPVNALRFISQSYSKDSYAKDPFISPVYADLTGLPPLLIQVSSTEVLYDDSVRIAENAAAAGVPCKFQVWDKMMHVFQILAIAMPEANQAVEEIGAFVRSTLDGEKPKRRRRARLLIPV